MELEPKQPGTYRIVLIGSSMAMGLFVPREMTFAALLPAEISELTGHRVELYNEATGGKFRGGPFPTPSSATRFKNVFAADPDMILWVVTPMDIENAAPKDPTLASVSTPGTGGGTPSRSANVWETWRDKSHVKGLGERLHHRWEETRTSVVLMHLLLSSESQDQYVDSYLKNEDDAEFLRIGLNAEWRHSWQIFESHAAYFAKQANAAGVPFVTVLVPNRAQAAMISRGEWPPGYDPYRIGEKLRTTIENLGGTYVDILPDLRLVPNPEQHYFPVDGHLNNVGHAMIARLLANKLSSGRWPELAPAPLTQGR
jgi:hypothetical protein